MIGEVKICGKCRTLMHAPTLACPEPREGDADEFAPLDPYEARRAKSRRIPQL